MRRRDLLKGLALLPLFANTALGRNPAASGIIKPKRLKKGDTVAIIAPSSGADEKQFEKAVQNMTDLGFTPRLGKYAREINGFLAGTDTQRIEDIHWAFRDKEIDAVWCVRGGYGLSRILPKIDYALIRKNPKIFIGYSDITALHLAIHQNTGMITFHGPVASSTYADYPKKHVINALMEPTVPERIDLSPDNAAKGTLLYKTQTITKGTASGRLIGGNLSLLTALAGTPYALRNTKGKILFIEDVGEKPYRIDRMFTQLKQSVNLRELAGIALGIFEGCDAPDAKSQTVIDVVKDQLGDLGIPVIYGLSFGHIRDQFTLPVGIRAELNADAATVTLLESGVA
jgi:muramoyltetrapeptide carboxypeptidase